MSEKITVDPKREFMSVIDLSPRAKMWHKFHTDTLPGMLKDSETHRKLDNMVHYFFRNQFNLKDEIPLPEIQWISNEDTVKNLTGGDLTVPVMELNGEYTQLFRFLVGESKNGGTVEIPIELTSLGGLTSADCAGTRLIILPDRSQDRVIPYEERRAHEFTHAVDPHLNTRDDALIMDEMIALIGSFSNTYLNRFTNIVLDPPYIIPYLKQHLLTMGIKEIDEDSFLGMVALINSIVYISTHIYPKIPNDQIAREMMKCMSLKELYRMHPEYFPSGLFPADENRIVIE